MENNGKMSYERDIIEENLNNRTLTWNEALTGFLKSKDLNLIDCNIKQEAKFMIPDILNKLEETSPCLELEK